MHQQGGTHPRQVACFVESLPLPLCRPARIKKMPFFEIPWLEMGNGHSSPVVVSADLCGTRPFPFVGRPAHIKNMPFFFDFMA